jgi:hypothetical protein
MRLRSTKPHTQLPSRVSTRSSLSSLNPVSALGPNPVCNLPLHVLLLLTPLLASSPRRVLTIHGHNFGPTGSANLNSVTVRSLTHRLAHGSLQPQPLLTTLINLNPNSK